MNSANLARADADPVPTRHTLQSPGGLRKNYQPPGRLRDALTRPGEQPPERAGEDEPNGVLGPLSAGRVRSIAGCVGYTGA